MLSEVTSVTEKSAAHISGLRRGDFLVRCQDEIVFFQSHEDIERNLKEMKDLSIQLEIERGNLEPMVAPSMDLTFEKSQLKHNSDGEKFTIVLDKDRGIYKI